MNIASAAGTRIGCAAELPLEEIFCIATGRAANLVKRDINELDRQKHGKLLKIPCDGGKFDFVFLFLTWSPVSDIQI